MMSKRDLSGMINQASSDLEPVRKRGRGLQGMFSDTSAPEQPEPEVAIIQDGETTLSEREAEELATCERIIERGLRTFLEVGSALLKIRDLRLYRNEYTTFEDYYRERWSLERSQVYRLMDAAEVTRNLQSSPMGEVPLPSNERQARPLTKLKDPEEQRKAWERAVTTAAGRVTAAHVESIVREMLAQAAPAAAAPSVDEHEAAPAQQVVIDHATEDRVFPDGEPASAVASVSSPTAASAHADRQQIIVWVEEDEADEDAAAARTDAGEPWPDNLFEIEARLAEEGWERVSESETRISYQRGEEHLRLVKPPNPHVVQLRLVAHASEDMEQVMAWLQRQIGAEFSRKPTGSWLPKYPERRRVYGAVSTAQQSYVDGLTVEAAALQARNADLEQKLASVQAIIEEYQEHITRAQKYKTTSDRGEAVSPLLRLVERVYNLLRDKQ
jgi:hypothetical protein